MHSDVDIMYGDNDIGNEISQECLNPDRLVGILTLALFKKTKSTSGHIYFHFQNKSDHIVFAWSHGLLKEIAAKSPGCKKSRCSNWEKSEFCDYTREEVLEELYDEIERIEIDREDFNITWPSYSEFIRWLIENNSFLWS